MKYHNELEEVECPRCDGEGGWAIFDENDVGLWELCTRCNGRGKILMKIREIDIEEEMD